MIGQHRTRMRSSGATGLSDTATPAGPTIASTLLTSCTGSRHLELGSWSEMLSPARRSILAVAPATFPGTHQVRLQDRRLRSVCKGKLRSLSSQKHVRMDRDPAVGAIRSHRLGDSLGSHSRRCRVSRYAQRPQGCLCAWRSAFPDRVFIRGG